MKNTKKLRIKDLMEEIENLKTKVGEIDSLNNRIKCLEENLHTLINEKKHQLSGKIAEKNVQCYKCDKAFWKLEDLERHNKSKHERALIQCMSCDEEFSKNSDLETHLEIEHQVKKTFKCEECDMYFMLKWRLRKHRSIHQENHSKVPFCHYFNNSKVCPFVNIGCMFRHADAPLCRFKSNCSKSLCQYKHTLVSLEKCDFEETCEENLDKHLCTMHETEILTEDEEIFNRIVEHNYGKIFDQYKKQNNRINCYYCAYTSKSRALENIQMELHKHLRNAHGEVVNYYEEDPDTFVFENDTHADFINFFADPPC